MLKFITSVRVPVRLFPRIFICEIRSPALAPPKGTVLVSAVNGPALSESWKSADGMLLPAPFVNADAELEKNAYRVRLPTLGFNSQEVVAVTLTLPGLLALPCVRLKFTALLESETEIESLRTACR